MIPLFLIIGLTLAQVMTMGSMPVKEGEILALASRTTITAEQNFDLLARQRVVLVGENHDDAEHHRVQLAIIRALKARRAPLAIGLEMIPGHLQRPLDLWVDGTLDETAFLDQLSWYTTWGFDAQLYLPIFRYARDHHVPLIALNVKRDLVNQVRKQGRQGVTDKVIMHLPSSAPPSADYENYLRDVFDSHPMMAKMGRFDRFVEAQQVWDTAMAARMATWVRDHPKGIFVGLVGSGHILGGYGIPHQLHHQNVHAIATVLPWTVDQENVDLHVADYVWGVPLPEPGPPPVRFGLSLEDGENDVVIAQIQADSPAARAGLKIKDRIQRLNGHDITNRHLFVRLTRALQWGDVAQVTIQRDGKIRAFSVALNEFLP